MAAVRRRPAAQELRRFGTAGQFLPLATGTFMASRLAILGPDAAARSSRATGHMAAGTHPQRWPTELRTLRPAVAAPAPAPTFRRRFSGGSRHTTGGTESDTPARRRRACAQRAAQRTHRLRAASASAPPDVDAVDSDSRRAQPMIRRTCVRRGRGGLCAHHAVGVIVRQRRDALGCGQRLGQLLEGPGHRADAQRGAVTGAAPRRFRRHRSRRSRSGRSRPRQACHAVRA